jgi:hypothetical protein
MKRQRTYDSSCLDLAELFLADEPRLRGKATELAQEIQATIEDWITDERNQLDQGERT